MEVRSLSRLRLNAAKLTIEGHVEFTSQLRTVLTIGPNGRIKDAGPSRSRLSVLGKYRQRTVDDKVDIRVTGPVDGDIVCPRRESRRLVTSCSANRSTCHRKGGAGAAGEGTPRRAAAGAARKQRQPPAPAAAAYIA